MRASFTKNIISSSGGGWGGLTPDAEGNIVITPGINPLDSSSWFIVFENPITGYKLKLSIAALLWADRNVEFPDDWGIFTYRINNIFTPDAAGNITLPLANTILPTYLDTSVTQTSWKVVFVCYAYSWDLNIYLNSAANNVGEFIFKKADATSNLVIINAGIWWDWQEYIDISSTSKTLYAEGEVLHIVSDNTWWVSIT